MEVNEEMEHIPYGDETVGFHDALRGNAANFERKLERVGERREVARGEESWQGLEITNKLEEAVAGLKEGEAEVEVALKKLERGNEAVAAFKNKVEEMAAEVAEAASSAQEFGGKAERREAEVAKLQRTVVNKEGQVEEERAKLETELARWKRSLGLEIVSTKSGITFIFTNLVREDPEKKFRCELGLEGGRYIVLHCLPQVNGLPMLVDHLNATKDLSGFMVTLRKKFAVASK